MGNGENGGSSSSMLTRVSDVFLSPGEAFQNIQKKPAWWIPLVITVLISAILQLWLMNITVQDQIAKMNAQITKVERQMAENGAPQERIDEVIRRIEQGKERVQGPAKYLGLIVPVVYLLLVWSLASALLMLGSNPIMGGNAKFGQIMGVVAWSSLTVTLGSILKSVLIFIQETSHGVTTSLAALMKVPMLAEKPSALYMFLSKMDPFMVWQVVLWGMGLALVANISAKKGYIVAFVLWFIWIAISIGFNQLLGNFM